LVEQLTLNQWVWGSSPQGDTIFFAEIAQLIEQLNRNQQVEGLIPPFGTSEQSALIFVRV
jgi:hypothetical protein